ncbi:MAG: glycine cleavage system protein GcvH [Gammaproteobacteria bacterium]|nr:glycine cleavage system protein GcvH [Gammaproteobacteria bacterium]MXY56510.1 glycine cleavage system protein GcvH [Gammaproteobacteria bacterium]MYF28659.1 glycine cleavage system protein GcvH [Gammaproteobacteria bacterium]MYK45012.1 glycine cleavage system protein GcvH [Gammaproteobacteria bacterium]
MNDVTSDTPTEMPDDVRYAPSHEWARIDDDLVTVGISDFAQQSLGDVVYVELPQVGDEVGAGTEACVVESVKAAADVYAPVSGTVVAVNEMLEEAPEMVNQDPYGDGWFFKVEPTDIEELDELLDADGYEQHCESEDDED